MDPFVLAAKIYMERTGLTDLKLAKKAIKAMIGFARGGVEIGVAGRAMATPDLKTCLAIQRGLNKLASEAKGPRKLFMPSFGDPKRKEWEALPGKEQRQCSRCRHVLAPGERLMQKTTNGITTSLCPRCLCDSYYAFKYEVRK